MKQRGGSHLLSDSEYQDKSWFLPTNNASKRGNQTDQMLERIPIPTYQDPQLLETRRHCKNQYNFLKLEKYKLINGSLFYLFISYF
uniref:Uncharacterized protein n=1 Tax=Manihot esculenta TaxID=3983 RepID=A0A2C9U4P7_MANES